MLRELIFDSVTLADLYDPAEFGVWNECSGEYYPIRSAGDRYTGPRLDVTDRRFLQGDALAALSTARKQMLKKLPPPATAEGQQWHRALMAGHYTVARLRAMDKKSAHGLREAEFRAAHTV
jgi:hypothetical protein